MVVLVLVMVLVVVIAVAVAVATDRGRRRAHATGPNSRSSRNGQAYSKSILESLTEVGENAVYCDLDDKRT